MLVSFLSSCSTLINAPPDREHWNQLSIDAQCTESKSLVYLDVLGSSVMFVSVIGGIVVGDPGVIIDFFLGMPLAYSAYQGNQKADQCIQFKAYKAGQISSGIHHSKKTSLRERLLELEKLRINKLISEQEYHQRRASLLKIK